MFSNIGIKSEVVDSSSITVDDSNDINIKEEPFEEIGACDYNEIKIASDNIGICIKNEVDMFIKEEPLEEIGACDYKEIKIALEKVDICIKNQADMCIKEEVEDGSSYNSCEESQENQHTWGQGTDCKKQWAALRDSFRRNMKKRKTKSGQAATATKKWKYEDEMNFLLPYLQDRPTISSISLNDETSMDEQRQELVQANPVTGKNIEAAVFENINEVAVASSDHSEEVAASQELPEKDASQQRPARVTKKRKKESEGSASAVVMKYLLESKRDKDNEVDTLFHSLAQTVKKMDPYRRAMAKNRVCAIVGELEIESIKSREAPHISPASTSAYSLQSLDNASNIASPVTPAPSEIIYRSPEPQPATSEIVPISTSQFNFLTQALDNLENKNNV